MYKAAPRRTMCGGVQIADEGFDGVHQENVILENIPKEKILGKLSEEEAKAGAASATFTPPPIDSILNLYDLEQARSPTCVCSLISTTVSAYHHPLQEAQIACLCVCVLQSRLQKAVQHKK